MRNKNDVKYLGREPEISSHPTTEELARALNWYNHFYAHDDPEIFQWLKKYLIDTARKDPLESQAFVSSGRYSKTLCFIARLLTNGLDHDKFSKRIIGEFEAFIAIKRRDRDRYRKSRKSGAKPRKENFLIADIDHTLDQFYNSDYMKRPDLEVFEVLSKYPSQQIKAARTHVEEIYEELCSKDPQVKEAYSHLSKKAMKNYVEFVKEILAKIGQEQENKKRKPAGSKKSKTKTRNSDFSKLKYQKHDEDTGVVSDERLIAIETASVIYLYNTKYRELRRLVTKEGFTVKGTTISGFCPEQSSKKKLRRPKEIVPEISSSTKRTCERLYRSVRAKEQSVNGRTNESTIILKIIK